MSVLVALLAVLALDLSEAKIAEICPEGGDPQACVEGLIAAGVNPGRADAMSPEVLAVFDAQCEADHGLSCNLSGVARESGLATTQDPILALGFYRLACEAGSGPGCQNRGRLLRRGEGVPADPAEALASYEAGCALAHAESCGMVAEMHYTKAAPQPSDALAYQKYVDVCYMGSGLGCYHAGAMKKEGRAPEDEDTVWHWMVRGCRAHDAYAPACVQAGLISETDGTERGPGVAREAYVRACEMGELDGCSEVGRALYSGIGGGTDAEMAVTIWRRGCAAGHGPSCTYLEKTGTPLEAPSGGTPTR